MKIQGEEIIINAQDFQISDSGIKLDIQGSTFIVSPIEISDSFEIVPINKSPKIRYSGNTPIFLTDNNKVRKFLFKVFFCYQKILWLTFIS